VSKIAAVEKDVNLAVPRRNGTGSCTVVDIQDQESLPFPKRIDKVDRELLRSFFDFPDVSLVVKIRGCGYGILRKINIQVVDHVREVFQL
jgi:hypothetical protein